MSFSEAQQKAKKRWNDCCAKNRLSEEDKKFFMELFGRWPFVVFEGLDEMVHPDQLYGFLASLEVSDQVKAAGEKVYKLCGMNRLTVEDKAELVALFKGSPQIKVELEKMIEPMVHPDQLTHFFRSLE